MSCLKLLKMTKSLKYLLLFIITTGIFVQSKAQVAPSGILFQAVARDANNNAAANRNVFAIVNILEGSATGSSAYTESFQVVSTKEGVFSIIIGQGTRVSGANSLVNLNWLNKTYFANIKIAIQPTLPDPGWSPNNNYLDIGTTQFWSVPYAFTAFNAKFADSAITINSILPGSKGGTGVNNNGKTITLGNNIITKGTGDLTITTTAASNVIFPTSGTLATLKDISDLIKTDTVSLSNRINTKLDSSQFPVLLAPYLQTISGMKYSDTSAMLSNRIARDTVLLSNRINTKLNILDTSAMLTSRFARDTASLSSRINSKVSIYDTSSMLSYRFARDTISLSNRINLKADKLNAKIDSSLYVSGKTTITDSLIAKGNVRIDSNLFVKGLNVATLTGSETLTNKSINGVTPTALANGFKVSGGTNTNTTLTVVGDVTVGGVNSGDQLISLSGDVSGSGTGTFSTTINNIGGKPIVLGGALTTLGSYSTTIITTGNTNVTMPTNGTIATLSGT